MPRKIKAKQILELRAAGLSRNSIAKSRAMSKTSVCEVFDRADEKGIIFTSVRDMTDEEVYRLLFPDKHLPVCAHADPNWDHIHKELSRVGVTLKLLHGEYVRRCGSDGDIAMGYNRFCQGYRTFTRQRNTVSHLTHKPAERIEVDWSGKTMQIVDEWTGEVTKVYLFVSCLPYSQYAYVEPTLDMTQDSWLRCHVRMFAFFGGSTPRLVPDNLKAGVTKHPREGDIILNDAYERLSEHYLCAVMPAGVKKPRHKPSVEGTVGKIATAIIARLRDDVFHSLNELRCAVASALDDFNEEPFQKREGSRSSIFNTQERPLLRALPSLPYEICEWVYGRKVGLDCHVVYAKCRYSVNHHFVGRKVDLRVTDTTLEVYCDNQRIASHNVYPAYVRNAYSTHDGDMPNGSVKMEWDEERIVRWAEQIGESTQAVICRIFSSVKVKEQAYNPSLSVLRLAKQYPPERLERACDMALEKVASPRWRHLKQILESNQDRTRDEDCLAAFDENQGGLVWGSKYYGGGQDA